MTLFVTRHGETTLNQQRKFYGALDVPIDEQGRQQASQLAAKLHEQPLDVIIRSDTRRTQQTAQPIIEDHPNAEVLINPGLNEKGFGDWEGLDADEIEAKDPVTWHDWIADPFDVTPNGAESFADFSNRVLTTVETLMPMFNQTANVLLVAHLGTLRVMHQAWVPGTVFWNLDFKAGHYSTYQIQDGKGRLQALNR